MAGQVRDVFAKNAGRVEPSGGILTFEVYLKLTNF